MNIRKEAMQQACKLISDDMNIYITIGQMIDMLLKNESLFHAVNDGGLSGAFQPSRQDPMFKDFIHVEHGDFVRDNLPNTTIINIVSNQLFDHYSVTLLSKPIPTEAELEAMHIDVATDFFIGLKNAAIAKGYIYSAHPSGPENWTY